MMDDENHRTTVLLHSTDDAMVWAEVWVATARQMVDREGDWNVLLDEGWMVGWFANAMQVAIDYHDSRRASLNRIADAAIHWRKAPIETSKEADQMLIDLVDQHLNNERG